MNLYMELKMKVNIILFLCIIAIFFKYGVESCNNYKLVVNHFKSCKGTNSIISPKNISFTLTDKCTITAKGCMSISKPFKTGKGDLEAKAMLTVKKPVDICDNSKDNLVAQVLASFIPFKCPARKGLLCAKKNNKYDVSAYKNQIPLLTRTPTSVVINLKHDSGVSCLDINLSLKAK